MAVKGKGAVLQWIKDRVGHTGVECLFWPFARNWNGYGHVSFEGKTYYAHRFMCEFAHGAAPSPNHVAAHSCGRGQGGCVNPGHLSWKTPSANQHDRKLHGTDKRHVYWTNRGAVPDEVIDRVRALKGKKNQREIASMFGISYQHVSLIQQGKLARQVRT